MPAPFTSFDIQTIYQMRDDGKPWREIDKALDRPYGSCADKITRMEKRKKNGGEKSGLCSKSIAICPNAMTEWKVRSTLDHQTITSAILGDPLPGQSALDRKRSMERAEA